MNNVDPQVVPWEVGIDDDGDLSVWLDGERIFYVDSKDGKLCIMIDREELLDKYGLSCDKKGAIETK